MKIPCNRTIETKQIGSISLQKRSNLKLQCNSRNSKVLALFAGENLFFSCHKRQAKNNDYTTVYLVSNINLKSKEY
jgi:hypothetical protein